MERNPYSKSFKISGGTTPASESKKCLELSDHVRDFMRRYVPLKIYGGKETMCAEAMAAKWRKMKNKSLVRLPPDEGTLQHHLN